jgi:hypothetical protein
MKITPFKTLTHQAYGTMVRGQTYEVKPADAAYLIKMNHAEEVLPDPTAAAGAMEPSSAWPAAPALPQTTANTSDDGAPKRRRRKATPDPTPDPNPNNPLYL